MSDLTAVSLFAGVGGIDIALERAGVTVTAAVEIDDAARGVLADRFPDTHLFTDVTKVTADELRATGFVPERGILAGGFPCQDLSVAGRRRGMGEGTRSGLFWHIDRLVADLRPRWLLLENVPGLLSSTCPCPGDGSCVRNGRAASCPGDGEHHGVEDGACPGGCIPSHGGAMGAVLGAVGKRGYGFAHRVLDAQFFGVPQRRRRVFIVGCLGDDRRPVQVLLEPEGGGGNPPQGQQAGAGVAATLTAGVAGAGVSAPGRRQEDDVNLVVANCLTAREGKGPDSDATTTPVVSALTANGVGTCGPDDNQAQAGHLVPFGNPQVADTLTACGAPEGGRTDKIPLATFQKVVRSGERDADGNLPPEVWAEREVAATLNLNDLGSESRAVELVVQPLALRGREDGAQLEVGPEGGPYNALRAGDGGSSRQSLVAITTTGDTTHTLTSEGADASEDGTGRGTPVVAFAWQAAGNNDASGAFEEELSPTLPKSQTMAIQQADTTVRRLTPMECERLQGFPDGHTLTSNGKPQADSARYRQMGNAVAVPCVEWIARRIVAADEDGAA